MDNVYYICMDAKQKTRKTRKHEIDEQYSSTESPISRTTKKKKKRQSVYETISLNILCIPPKNTTRKMFESTRG